jgi:hypothetical protein
MAVVELPLELVAYNFQNLRQGHQLAGVSDLFQNTFGIDLSLCKLFLALRCVSSTML